MYCVSNPGYVVYNIYGYTQLQWSRTYISYMPALEQLGVSYTITCAHYESWNTVWAIVRCSIMPLRGTRMPLLLPLYIPHALSLPLSPPPHTHSLSLSCTFSPVCMCVCECLSPVPPSVSLTSTHTLTQSESDTKYITITVSNFRCLYIHPLEVCAWSLLLGWALHKQ